MNENLAYELEIPEELLDGVPVAMSPRPSVRHNFIAWNVYSIFRAFLKNKPCKPFADGEDLYLSEKDHFIPDMMVVCKKDKIQKNGVYGAPSLVVEVLSPSSSKRDRGYKKNAYEAAGVREYWIVDPSNFSVEVYLLQNGKYILDDVYTLYRQYEKEECLTEEEKAAIPESFSCRLFPSLEIPLEDVFEL